MAAKNKKTTDLQADESPDNVTRISASDSRPKKAAVVQGDDHVKEPRQRRRPLKKAAAPFRASGGYFKGAWYELMQVHWPNRRATWGMTGALLAFTAFFIVLILLLDALFKYLFQLMLG